MATVPNASTSQSLLSRIAPSTPNSPASLADRPALRKRSISEETNQRGNKRRRGTDERNGQDSTYVAPWLKFTSDLEAEPTREKRLHVELLQVVDYITPSKQEQEVHNILVSRIRQLFKTRWPDAEVTVFGSSATGLGLTGGDIDLVVSFDAIHSMSELDRKARLAAMGDVLKRSRMTTWVNRIFGARVPIIAFATTSELGEVSFDISIRNSEDAGVRVIPLIKQFLVDMPALRSLILAVKAFLSLRDLNDASQGTLSSYAITLMCINFLQRNPGGRPKEQLDDPYVTKSLGFLLMDFFRYYGHDFPYLTHYVSVSNRDILPKKLMSWEAKRGGPAVLAVQCILNPENNITRGCSMISLIIDAFREALDILQNATLKGASAASSLLSRIYEIPEEDQTRRALIDKSVDSGVFSKVATSCLGEISTRTVSGGVLLANRSGRERKNNRTGNEPSLLMRLGPGPMQPSTNGSTTGQLPVLRWSHDRGKGQRGPNLPSGQFTFQPQVGHYQMPQQQVHPSVRSYAYHENRFHHNPDYPRFAG